jgi:hypothetical protein
VQGVRSTVRVRVPRRSRGGKMIWPFRRRPAWKCAEHGPQGLVCFCDERRDREAGVHRASGLSDAFGGYLCVCLRGSFSVKYGCMAPDAEEVPDA